MSNRFYARNYMSTKLITVNQHDDVYAAISKLLKHKISGTPVVDDSGNLKGILSEKDCLRINANGSFYEMPGGDVSRYMTNDVMTVHPETDIFVIADLFLKHHFRRVPVLENGKLVGLISRRDVLRAVQDASKVKPIHTNSKEYLSPEMKSSLNR